MPIETGRGLWDILHFVGYQRWLLVSPVVGSSDPAVVLLNSTGHPA